MGKLLLEVVTFEKEAFKGEVEKVFAQTDKGIIGILPKHAPLLTLLESGELKIVSGGKERFYSIGGGFLEVKNDKVKIMVTRAVAGEEIIESQVEKAKKRAEKIISEKGESLEAAKITFRRSLIDLKVARKARRRKRVMEK